jgi:hypothetical protein
MPRRKSSEPSSPPEVSHEQGIQLLQTQIAKGQALLSCRPLSFGDYSAWKLVTQNYLEKTFGSNSPNVSSVTDVGPAGAFAQEYTVMRNTLSDNKLHGHEKASQYGTPDLTVP